MNRFRIAISFLILAAASIQANALEVRFHPGDQVYLNVANKGTNTYDLVAHLVVIKNDSTEKVTLENFGVQLFADQRLVQEVYLSAEDAVKSTAELVQMNQQGMQIMTGIMCPPEALGKDGTLASSAELMPGQALTSRNLYVTVQTVPTRMRFQATAKTAAGASIEASTEIKVVLYESANKYISPLNGEWFLQSVPNVTSHHRWISQTEFGIDYLKLDGRGLPWKTDGKQASDFYAYGQPVLAAADGTVVTAINDAVQNWDMWIPREGESYEDFEKRAGQFQLESMKKDLYRAVTGNLVVIEHANKEYSAYAHLKTGSVKVKPGDRVQQGQQIGEVGDTGDYYWAHLHFQISNHPDVLRARSLPFTFTNMRMGRELGHFAASRQ